MKFRTNEELKIKRIKKDKLIEKCKLILVILISIIILYNLIIIIEAVRKPNQTPSVLGFKTFTVISGSMEPKIHIGDIIIVKKDTLKKDDIITYRKNNEIITHRIVEIIEENNQKKYITKGDNNETEDEEYVFTNEIEGKVIGTIRKLGFIIIFLQNKTVICIIIIIFGYSYTKDLKRNNKKQIRRQKREMLKEKETKNEK